jgi:hypothetical protein
MAGPLVGESNDPGVAGVQGIHTAGQAAVIGESADGRGVLGISERGQGVWGHSESSTGVVGVSTDGFGTSGQSVSSAGVAGISDQFNAVRGISHAADFHGAVVGINDNDTPGVVAGPGVFGQSNRNDGVHGTSQTANGVYGRGPTGGFFEGGSAAGVRAVALGTGAAILATGRGQGDDWAGVFEGNVRVNKSVTTTDVLILGADCAEDFETMSSAPIEPGTVMAIGDDARLVESDRAYDKRVAGIVSGAGDYKPGIVLGKDASRKDRVPLALIGRVFCKVDATDAPIEVGDLLTTSPTQGHAMKAEDPLKAFGAVIGKALAPLREGYGLLPILVALQ